MDTVYLTGLCVLILVAVGLTIGCAKLGGAP